jgi:indolepyruvate ferredoxin oxidoreductase
MMILGAAYQKGWVPVTEDQILEAVKESVRKADVDSNREAFRLGRYMAFHPELLHPEHESERVEAVIAEKTANLRQRSFFFGRRLASQYKTIMDDVCRWMDLSMEQKCLMARLVYDLIRYENATLAQKFVSSIWNTHKRDQKRFGFRATQAVIKNLYKCLAIKDEVWVAELLTSPEKYARDKARYSVDTRRGDKISYVHLNRPQFTVLGFNIEFDVQTKDWMLRLMRKGKFLRRLLPGWHTKEKAFRDWYVDLVRNFHYFESGDDYDAYAKALSQPEIVKGYREIRYPLMEQAKKMAHDYLEQIQTKKYKALARLTPSN